MNNMMYEDQPQHHGVKPNYSDNITAAKMREIAEVEEQLKKQLDIIIANESERILNRLLKDIFEVVNTVSNI